MNEEKIKETKQRFGRALLAFLGKKELVSEFIEECKLLGLDIKNPKTMKKMMDKPHLTKHLLSHSLLGTMKTISKTIKEIKE